MKSNTAYKLEFSLPWRLVVLHNWGGRDETDYSSREEAEKACERMLATGTFAYVRMNGKSL